MKFNVYHQDVDWDLDCAISPKGLQGSDRLFTPTTPKDSCLILQPTPREQVIT